MTENKSQPTLVYQLKITLEGGYIRPPIWRRVQGDGDITLARLHRIIQAVMGWYDCHLHLFEIDDVNYGVPYPDDFTQIENEKSVKLNKVVPYEKSRFLYEYDFGDSWGHDILVEKILPSDPDTKYPVCLKGKRACPPEDIGGEAGYSMLLLGLENPKNREYKDFVDQVDGVFDPEEFDLEQINLRLRKIR